jgi:hypothetical protein
MSQDTNLEMMNAIRKQTVQEENAKTFNSLTEVLAEQIQLAYAQLQEEDKKLENPLQDYNTHQVCLYLNLNLQDFYKRLPHGQNYRIYWQPSNIHSPQAMEIILRHQYDPSYDPDLILGNVLTGCSLPILEEFRQHLRQRYPNAMISSHYMGGANPQVRINITYKMDYQQGIPVMLHQKKCVGGGTVWNTEKIQQTN